MIRIWKLFLILCFAILLFSSCSSNKISQSRLNTVILVQDGKQTKLKKVNHVVTIDADKFALRFFNKIYDPSTKNYNSASIAAFLSSEEFDKLKTNIDLTKHPNFRLGTGMAGGRLPSNKLIFKEEAHQSTYYKNEVDRRLNLIEKLNDDLLLEFEVSSLQIEENTTRMSDTNLKQFYIALIIDRNNNNQIDQGELTKLTVKIRKQTIN